LFYVTSGELTPVSATTQTQHSPNSEPTTRRLSTRPLHHHKAQTEPISASVPSSTFKILSICRKWSHGRSWDLSDSEDAEGDDDDSDEFDDDSDELEEDLDDECQENCLVIRSYRHLQQQLNIQQQ
uniref:Uncharacterized protein n=1 Tax=Anisakis simplex TaxID=6269 RepID=A0A0M3JMI9_ANISI